MRPAAVRCEVKHRNAPGGSEENYEMPWSGLRSVLEADTTRM
jgi:hypothetical protein